MTRRPPTISGYPDARPVRDGLRLAVWTLRGFAHGAARRKSKPHVRLFSGWMLIIGICLFPVLVVSTPTAIALRRGTRYYMTPDRDARQGPRLHSAARYRVGSHAHARPGRRRPCHRRRQRRARQGLQRGRSRPRVAGSSMAPWREDAA